MRIIYFDKIDNDVLLDLQLLIKKLINEKYTLSRIKVLFDISSMQLEKILAYDYQIKKEKGKAWNWKTDEDISIPKKIVAHEIEESIEITYESLSESEKIIYKNTI
jgi:hypothetical protein